MATVPVRGTLSTFGRNVAQIPGIQAFLVPPTVGLVTDGTDTIMVTEPIPFEIAVDGTGNFVVWAEPVINIRPDRDRDGRPWGYGIRLTWPDPDAYGVNGGFSKVDIPSMRVYVTAPGGQIGPMLSAGIRFHEVWVTDPGVEVPGGVAGDLVFNYRAGWLSRIN